MAEQYPGIQHEYENYKNLSYRQLPKHPEYTEIVVNPVGATFGALTTLMESLAPPDEDALRRRMISVASWLIDEYGFLNDETIRLENNERDISEHIRYHATTNIEIKGPATSKEVKSAFEDFFPNEVERDKQLLKAISATYDRRAKEITRRIAYNQDHSDIPFPPRVFFRHDPGIYLDDAAMDAGLLEILNSNPDSGQSSL